MKIKIKIKNKSKIEKSKKINKEEEYKIKMWRKGEQDNVIRNYVNSFLK